VLWRGFSYGVRPNIVSIPGLVEENADTLKARYLAWVYELGETRIQGRRLVNHLELRPGFSYWWMSLFVEKCNYSKSPQIEDAIRLMAFADWAADHPASDITLTSANKSLAESMRLWCVKTGVPFEWQYQPKPTTRLSWGQRACSALPYAIKAHVWLLHYLIERWPLRGVGLNEWRKSEGRITFFSYSDNCVPESVKQGRYENRYWTLLPDVLKREACKTNWLHIYVKDSVFPSARNAAASIRAINKIEMGQQRHVTLDTFLGLAVLIRALRDWARLAWIGARLSKEVAHTMDASVGLWPLFCEDWRKSMFGTNAMANVLSLNLFEAALASLPKQRHGVYLQENQGWEFGLIHVWQAAGHARLVGAPHSTVRFWDLRYFFDPRSYVRMGNLDLPMPNCVACNGPVVRDIYRGGSYPSNDLVNVEALRYLHLGDANTKPASAQATRKDPIRLLVLGDYLSSNTERQMKLLVHAVPLLSVEVEIVVKPHPNCPVHQDDYPGLHMQVTSRPIADLLDECDFAYSSAVTSAAVDAYCAGVPIVSMLDPKTFNFSPLRGCAGALFASTPEELVMALMSDMTISQSPNSKQGFFTIDSQFPRWQQLLLE
jgi:surface carbohydrate biosynthesis protein (TIGR04326 family)